MILSARNQLKATVAAVKPGAVNNEVTLRLEKGTLVTSIITAASCENLGLKEGAAAFAVVKASNVMIGEEGGKLKLSARNQFAGTVKAVAEGAVNAEVAVTLDGGEEITSIITMTSAKKLALAPGKKVLVVVKASDVMVGVEA